MNRSINELSLDVYRIKNGEGNDSNIDGSPYLADDFANGNIYYEGKYEVSDVPLRYNIFNDEMEFKIKEIIMAIANPKKLDKVLIGEEVFVFLNMQNGSDPSGYAKKWNSGYPALLTKMKVIFQDQEAPKAYVDAKPARFVRSNDEHFVMVAPEKIEDVKSVKKLIEALGGNQQELTAFAKKEKISANKPEELSRLLDFYQKLK
ncbi:MAG: hypothetical protein HC819_05090 [Cyclobacteriaceae bacterium]|nr:hypothetical protein [Cyclobacteriaceae bacterium]